MCEQPAVHGQADVVLLRDKDATLRSMKAALEAMEVADARSDRLGYARSDTAFHEAFFQHCV